MVGCGSSCSYDTSLFLPPAPALKEPWPLFKYPEVILPSVGTLFAWVPMFARPIPSSSYQLILGVQLFSYYHRVLFIAPISHTDVFGYRVTHMDPNIALAERPPLFFSNRMTRHLPLCKYRIKIMNVTLLHSFVNYTNFWKLTNYCKLIHSYVPKWNLRANI